MKRELLRALSAGPRTCSELAEALGVERGGSISENRSGPYWACSLPRADGMKNAGTGKTTALAAVPENESAALPPAAFRRRRAEHSF